ncbi:MULTISPECIES: DUF6456 domain-containing protein [unclassified Xanthobacter]|uniref:DUF6456 domain-containing protein n=1 Tax=unclassified Xanthobacter TaxID=2623496 RepID=UPI001EDE3D95|nr:MULTISPECIES: DUF6456 domain-containing protein [unclassified Xanthobacter]
MPAGQNAPHPGATASCEGTPASRTTRPRRRKGSPASASAAPPAPSLNLAESPLTWLARRNGKDGRPLVDEAQLAAGERLRADFTRAQLTPRVTSNWSALITSGRSPEAFTDMVLAARQRLRHALAAVGPELSGVLLDVCCFLKGLEAVEGERRWPPRTAKVVLGLALQRLAAHYGLATTARGRARGTIRAWSADDDPPA